MAEINCAATVANAAPATPKCNPKIKRMSNTILIPQDAIKK